MPRKNIVAGNWKMNTTLSEAIELVEKLRASERTPKVITIIAPPSTHLASLKKRIKGKDKIYIAAQNCHHKLAGAYTGEISPAVLKDLQIPYVILGHSERREYNFETNEILALKLKCALSQGLKVIFCCGESLDVRKSGNHVEYVVDQLKSSVFASVDVVDMKSVIIAYEPIWAIGTGETASPEQAQEMHAAIRKSIQKAFGKRVADNTSILYGGSVKGSNAKELFANPDVDGALVGGASLDPVDFVKIIHSLA
jgi:triosephosphate isomerase